MATLIDVSDALAKLGKFYGKAFDDPEVLTFYADTVCSVLTPEQAMEAIRRWSVSHDRFPVPAQLIAIIAPPVTERDTANELANSMLGAISRRGYTWPSLCRYDGFTAFPEALEAEFGDDRCFDVIERCGGWAQFCQQFDPVVNTNARPQLRDLLEAQARITANDMARLPPNEAKLIGNGKKRDTVGEYLAEMKKKDQQRAGN